METVQRLRRKAEAAGQFASDTRLRVADDGGNIAIEQADPQVVYVPYYDPLVVYGTWWWPSYPPVAWAPWPGYVVVRSGFWWGSGIRVSAGFFFGSVSWPRRHVAVVRISPYYVRPPATRSAVVVHRPLAVGQWRHDPDHRRGVVYRSPEVQRKFVPAAPARAPRIERREVRPAIRREERRDDRRGHAMPPALRASPPVAARARPQAQPRLGAQRPQTETGPRFRAAPREHPGNRNGGWRPQADRAARRG